MTYHNTLPAFEIIKPDTGIFLEFAPISRSYNIAFMATLKRILDLLLNIDDLVGGINEQNLNRNYPIWSGYFKVE